MIEYLQQIDTDMFLALNGMHCPVSDRFMYLFSGKLIWVPMYAALLYTMIRSFSPRKALFMAIGIALTILIADQLCATLLRPIFERLRPANLENPLSAMTHIVDGYRGGRYSFPSCHAANTFALAGFVWFMIRKPGIRTFVVAWAVVTCWSRISLGVHYPGDLITGGCIGIGIGIGCYFLTEAVLRLLHTEETLCDTEPLLTVKAGSRQYTLHVANLMPLTGIITTVTILAIALTLTL